MEPLKIFSLEEFIVCICHVVNQLVICGIDFVHVYIFDLLIKAYLSLMLIKYLFNKSNI